MFAIIFWVNDTVVKPLLNSDGSLRIFETIEEADKVAESVVNLFHYDTRVISIEGASE